MVYGINESVKKSEKREKNYENENSLTIQPFLCCFKFNLKVLIIFDMYISKLFSLMMASVKSLLVS